MGNPDARQYITDLISDFIQANKLDWYRQDFNIWPLQSWRKHDQEDRQGMTENLHIQGYLQFWDDLLRRNPGLKIDSCAGGGRRNEMETMRRSVPLHYTDGPANVPHIRMGFEQTLHEWTPYFRSFMLNAREQNEPDEGKSERNADEFLYYCSMAPSVVLCTDFYVDDKEFDPVRKMQDTWYRAAHLMLRSDFYSLTPYHKDRAGWWCRQFDCPEHKDGFIQFVTGKGCTQEELVVKPCLDENATYLFENEQTGQRRTMTGVEAMEGFTEKLPARSGSVWFYHAID